ncbi:MAG: class I SAM-dependent methyltransferase [Alphaproteobacteria bacterium]|nr:class I SAM-dependent methyltransferase [Alphaproteobacteria bacterium]
MTKMPSLHSEAQDLTGSQGLQSLGLGSSWAYHDDPRHLLFSMARYKFVAKMFLGLSNVLEVGCADGFFTRIVLQAVGRVTGIDIDGAMIESASQIMSPRWPFTALRHDILERPVEGLFDGAYSLDVLEHIPASQEELFIMNILASLKPEASLIVGMPSLQSQAHASQVSRAHHVNCKDQPELKTLLSKFFHNVFLFSMNDEIVHTGFHPMSHYNLALCCHRKETPPC